MYLSGVPVFSIMLIGRWSTTAFLKYIQKQVQEFLHGISSMMTEVQTFKHVRNPTEMNMMEYIVGDLFLLLLWMNWWRKHHCQKDEGGVKPINNWFQSQPLSKLFIGYLTIPCTHLVHFSVLSLGGEFSARWTPLAEDTLFLGVLRKGN